MLTCNQCQADFSEEEAIKEKSGKHIKASCPYCNRYIKFLPQETTPMEVLPFGKYKGRTCMSVACEDRGYAEWAVKNMDKKYKEAFSLALQSLS